METITITLDGVEVSGYSGMTVLELAQESGVNIPTLCHDAYLTSTGACRLCIVEDERSRALLASCVAPIAPGMLINTRSPRVIERRKAIIKLLLASHPDSCLVCDKGNRCQLRKLAAEMGIGLVDFQRIPLMHTIAEVNPFIERDLSKCILCAKCIRADQELVVNGAIDYLSRGFTTKPATLGDLPLEKSECVFCGTCVAMCPTGALMEKDRVYTGTTAVTVSSVCPFCGCGCNIRLEVKDNRVVRARPDTQSPVSRGALCVRGSYGYDFIHSPERLPRPLLKNNGSLQPVSWEQAITTIATEFKRIKDSYGADSLAVLGSSKCTNEENYLLQRFARGVIGTNNIDNGSRLYNSASRIGLGWTIGCPGTTSSIDELERSAVIMVIGANPDASAPVVGYTIKRAVKRAGAKLILVDPRQTKLAWLAHLWLRPGLGTDVALLNGIARVIIEESLLDEEFVTRRMDKFAELSKSLEPYTPEYVAALTSVPARDIQYAARLLARQGPASIVYGNGITQYLSGAAGVMALANIAMLTGNTGHSGGGIFALQRENNAQGACDMGCLPDFLPGYQSIDNAQARQNFEERWKVRLPTGVGLTALEMIEQARVGKIKGMLIMGENPMASFPRPSVVKEALASLECLVVADMFLTATARLATVVLPAASFAETEGTFTNFEGRVQRIRQAIEPIGDSLPDWKIILQLAEGMGGPLSYSSPSQIMEEVEEMVPLYQPQALSDFDKEDWSSEGRSGVKRLFQGPFPNGFGRFSPVEYTPPQNAEKEYPLALIVGSILPHFGSGTRSFMSSRLKKFSPNAWVEISEADAQQIGLGEGEMVKVASPTGAITTRVKITDTLPPGMLFVPISFPDTPVQELFDMTSDPRTRTPSLKHCAVRLERIS